MILRPQIQGKGKGSTIFRFNIQKRRIQEMRVIMIIDWYFEPFPLLNPLSEIISDKALLGMLD
jgi:hypothetical protein